MPDALTRDLELLRFSGIVDVQGLGQVVVLKIDATTFVSEILGAIARAVESDEAEIVDRLREFAWHHARTDGLQSGSLDPVIEEVDAARAADLRDEALQGLLSACDLASSDLVVRQALGGVAAPTLASVLIQSTVPATVSAHLRLRTARNRAEQESADA